MYNKIKRLITKITVLTNTTVKKLLSIAVWQNTYDVLSGHKLTAYWWKGNNNENWGDKINPWLMQRLSGKEIVHVDDIINFWFINVYTCIGSVVEHLRYSGVHIWGPGIISQDSALKIKPKRIHAVRGPLTRSRFKKKGFNCPEVYGDPALLLPKFYTPDVVKTTQLGIIPHYVDKGNENVLRILHAGDVMVIDIYGGETEFIDQVNRCKHIVSSSLHGLIVADAYGIPSKWIKLSDNVYGDDFKYGDYYQSIGVIDEKPIVIESKITASDLINACWKKEMGIDLNRLIDSCPYYKNEQ